MAASATFTDEAPETFIADEVPDTFVPDEVPETFIADSDVVSKTPIRAPKTPSFESPLVIGDQGPVYQSQIERDRYGSIEPSDLTFGQKLRRTKPVEKLLGPTPEEIAGMGGNAGTRIGALPVITSTLPLLPVGMGGLAGKALMTYFAADLAKQQPEIFRQAKAASERGDWSEFWSLVGQDAFAAAMTALGLKSVFTAGGTGRPEPDLETMKRANVPGLLLPRRGGGIPAEVTVAPEPITGEVLSPMRGAPVQRIEPPIVERATDPAALATQMQREATAVYSPPVVRPPRPTVPEGPLTPPPDVAAAAPVEMGRGWTDFVAELQSRGTGNETIADIQQMFPQMQMNREGAQRLGRDAFGNDWRGGGDGGGAVPTPESVVQSPVAPAPAAAAAAGPPFLGADKSTWTPEYLADRLGQPGNLRAIVNSINNAPELRRKFPIKEDAKPETILKAIHDLIDARAKATPPRPPPPPPEGGAPVLVPEPPTKPIAPAEGAKANPHDFVPAVQDIAGENLIGEKGKNHEHILQTQKAEDYDWLEANFKHVREGEMKGRGFWWKAGNGGKGEFVTRERASELLGEKEALHSERLKSLQETTPENPVVPPAARKKRGGFTIPNLPGDKPSIIQAIHGLQGIRPPGEGVGGEYDGYKANRNGIATFLFTKNAVHRPDTIIAELHNLDSVGNEAGRSWPHIQTPDDLWNAIQKETGEREQLAKTGGGELAQFDRFWQHSSPENKKGLIPKNVQDLKIGDKFKLRGSSEELTVTAIDQDASEVQITGDRLYGKQWIPEGAEIWVREKSFKTEGEADWNPEGDQVPSAEFKAGDKVDHQGQTKTIQRMSPDGKFAVIGNRAIPVSELKPIEAPAEPSAEPQLPDGVSPYAGAEGLVSVKPKVGEIVWTTNSMSGKLDAVRYEGPTGEKFDQHPVEKYTWLTGPEKGQTDANYGRSFWSPAKPPVAPPAEPTVPKLRPGEKGTGEILQGSDAPFNLAGETAVDAARIAAEAKAKAESAAAAKALADKQQQDLFGKPTPTAEGAKGIGGQAFKDLRDKLDRNEGGGRDFTKSIVDAGTYLYQKGMKFADWSARMVKEFGSNVSRWLKTAWDHVVLRDISRIERMNDATWNNWYRRMKFGSPGAVQRLGQRFGIDDLPDLLNAHKRGMAGVKPLSERAMAVFKSGNTVEGNRLMTQAQEAAKRAQTFHELARHIPEVESAIKGIDDSKVVRAKMDSMASDKIAALVKTTAEATPANAGVPIPKTITDALKKIRDTIRTVAKTKGSRAIMSWTKDAAGNLANNYGQQVGNDVRGNLRRAMGRGKKPNVLDENALTFVRESDGDATQLMVMRAKIAGSTIADPKWKAAALKSIDHAESNWDRLNPIASQYALATDAQIAAENAAGINTLSRKGYVMHAQDVANDFGLFADVAGEGSTGFKHARTHDTFADSIAAGIDPKSLNAVTLLTQRIAAGQRLINNRMWVEGLKSTTDPQTGKSIITEPEVIPRGPGLPPDVRAPRDYVTEIAGGRPIAVLKSYAGIFRALTEPSKFSESLGWNATLKVATTGKHVALMLDTFHLGRIALWESIIKPLSLTDPKLPLPSYKRGVLTLDYSPAELRKMAAAGEINPKHLNAILSTQRDVNGLVKNGYNVSKITDMMHQEWLQKIPVTGAFNKWLFTQFQRGAMAEVGSLEVGRYRRMNPSWTDQQVYRAVAKDLNTRFGNLGRQGLLKSKTALDTARLMFLAPQWNEGLIRSELWAVTGAVKGVRSSIKEGRLSFGILPRAVGAMLLGQFAANQIINFATRGKPTWENEEEGVGAKLSAWVPDVVGDGPGFFLHPAGLAAEITHLLSSKYEKKADVRDAIMGFMGGRWSTLARPVMTFLNRRDVFQRLIRPENIWKETGKAAIPLPIGASAAVPAVKQQITGERKEQFPGQYQKQLMASVGVKTDQAPSADQRIQKLAGEFRKSKGITESGEFYESAYVPLRQALQRGAVKEARQAYQDLIASDHTSKQIANAVKPWTGGNIDRNTLTRSQRHRKPFSGHSKFESEFLDSLSQEQLDTAEKAYQQRVKTFELFQDMLSEM